jgi:hypothetical protein
MFHDDHTTRLIDTDTRMRLAVRPYVWPYSPATEVIPVAVGTSWDVKPAEPAKVYEPRRLKTPVLTPERLAVARVPCPPAPPIVASAQVVITPAAAHKRSKIAMQRANVRGLLPW